MNPPPPRRPSLPVWLMPLTGLASLVVVLAFAVAATTSPTTAPTLTPVKIGTKTYQLETAADQASREQGLMDRDTMASDHGMIFVFTEEKVLKFWMHHTRFPLDIVFVDGRGRVVSVHQMQAYDESTTSSDLPAKYAIELSDGQDAASGVRAGDHVAIPAGLDALAK